MNEITLLQFVVLLGFCLNFGECLHCWECNSHYDPNCGEPFKNHTISLADCGQRFLAGDMSVPSTICRKISQKVSGQVRIIRSCGFYNPEDAGQCIYRAGTHLVYMHYCQCAGEGCNHAATTLPSSFALAAAILSLLSLFVLT